MGQYLTPLITEDLDGRWFKLLQDFQYRTSGGMTITVPKGFISDGASVPRGFWNIMPRTGKAKKPGVIHDWEYFIERGTRKAADKRFMKMLILVGYSKPLAYLAYKALRIGAGRHWGGKGDKIKKINGAWHTKRGPHWMPFVKEQFTGKGDCSK